ncbi:hypothetical protein CVT26_007625 [Gymnopilus dilepis]|uniref:WSC domain-containing protein n=1 Tax=Gymnopilus dilepis TaxID=231916 RepID=A0A409VZM4_9AGAR|nr:hypothetical protein CVT26_007625 [Gymnopilus dilepis]
MSFIVNWVLSILLIRVTTASPALTARQTASNLPDNWVPAGCFSDSTSSRTLRVASFTDVNNMTIEWCLSFCTPAGYNFAGVEFARLSIKVCDNIIESPGQSIDGTSCDMSCTGDSDEICGGSNAISVFHNALGTPNLPQGWDNVGCYSDSPDARTLRTAAFTDVTNMTIESCLAFCTPAGYNFAGVEFSRVLYNFNAALFSANNNVDCDNDIEAPGSAINSTNCNMPCAGNSAEFCGGSGAINIFKNIALPPPPSIKQTVGTFEYKGCFEDGVDGAPRSLQHEITIAGGATAETCTAACQAAGFPLAGLEFGKECWCDSYFLFPTVSPDSECSSICDADNSELCGAGNRLAVYQDTNAVLDSQQCLNGTQLRNNVLFNLHTIAADGTNGISFILGAFETTAVIGDPRDFFFLEIDPSLVNAAHIFDISGGVLIPTNEGTDGIPLPIQPAPGGAQEFVSHSNIPEFNGYCAKPNPISPGLFLGPPVLSVSGEIHWALCPSSSTPVVSPQPSQDNCTKIFVTLTPPVINF